MTAASAAACRRRHSSFAARRSAGRRHEYLARAAVSDGSSLEALQVVLTPQQAQEYVNIDEIINHLLTYYLASLQDVQFLCREN